MNDISTLRERLDELGDEAGHLQVDIGRAMARGRAILRLQRAATATGSAALVGAVAVAVAVAGWPGRTAAKPGTARPAAAAAHARPGELAGTARFGWLPAGFATTGFVINSQGQPYFEVEAGSAKGVLLLTDYGRGPQPALLYGPGGVLTKPIAADDVNGHPAYWAWAPTIAPGKLGFDLRWQYAPGHWAELRGNGLPAASVASLTSMLYQVARTATLGSHTHVSLPFTVSGIPAGLRLRLATVNGLGDGGMLLYEGSSDSSSDSIQFFVFPARLSHRASNTVIDGHPAYDSQLTHPAWPGALRVYGVDGWDVQILADPAAMPGSHNLIWLFHHLTILQAERGQARR